MLRSKSIIFNLQKITRSRNQFLCDEITIVRDEDRCERVRTKTEMTKNRSRDLLQPYAWTVSGGTIQPVCISLGEPVPNLAN